MGNAGYQSNVSSAFTWDANLQANSVSFTNLGSGTGGQKILFSYNYSISNVVSNTYTLPIDLTSYGAGGNLWLQDFDKPKYLIGTNVPANEVFPYYQNTSSTADGFYANSTAQYQPGWAGALKMDNGDNNWWVLDYKKFPTTIPIGESYIIKYDLGVVANVNTTIQTTRFATYSNGESTYSRNDSWNTINLTANVPCLIESEIDGAGSAIVSGAGYMIRNMVSSTQVDTTQATFTVYQRKQ